MFKLTDKPIDSAKVLAGLRDDRAGAAVAFEGWVRNHNQGLKGNSLEYQVYEELAISEGKKILTEASDKFNILKINEPIRIVMVIEIIGLNTVQRFD